MRVLCSTDVCANCYSCCDGDRLRRRIQTETAGEREGGGGVGVGGKRENEMSRDGMGLDETDRSVRPAFVSLICQVSLVCVRSICHASVGY